MPQPSHPTSTSFTVAIVGPDGAGKTTIARRLEHEFPELVKYLYMGINAESSNVVLPTTRLVEFVKDARRRKNGKARMVEASAPGKTSRKSSSRVRAVLRLGNRLAEEWYRQILSWYHQAAGRIVVYDRHFQLDFELDQEMKGVQRRRFTDWLHRWMLARVYPKPDLVIYLDAPAEILFARKGEASLEWLESRRQACIRQGRQRPNFLQIDATAPLEEVYATVVRNIMGFTSSPPQRVQRLE